MFTAMPVDFRLSAWPLGGAYVTTFTEKNYSFHLRPVLEYLKDVLSNLPVAHVNKTQFTLLNIYSSYTKSSFGKVEPNLKTCHNTVTFTFALGGTEDTSKLNHVFWLGRNCVWGNTKLAEFVSITLPLDLSTECRMYNMLGADHRNFYNVVGAYTKAIIQSRSLVSHDIYNVPITHAMKMYPMSQWKYVLDFWRRAPSLIEAKFEPEFLAYWHFRLANEVTPEPYLEDLLIQRYREFLLGYRTNTLSPEEKKIAYLAEGDLTDMETRVNNLVRGLAW